jgi:hypothetical protein
MSSRKGIGVYTPTAMVAFCHKEITADGEVMQGTLSSPRIGWS